MSLFNLPRTLALGLTTCLAAPAITLAADQAAPAAKPASAAKAPVKKVAAKPATPRQQLNNEAKGLALATETAETISAGQLDVAARVLTGTADCEFKQRVEVQAIEGKPGYFRVEFKGQRYTMVPEETQTGAVRLVDKKAGVVWLQIPVKSMLMNTKIGQRMVDACTQSEQRAAVAAVTEAGQGFGIAPAKPAAAPASAGSAAK
jgi:hypothetical protein